MHTVFQKILQLAEVSCFVVDASVFHDRRISASLRDYLSLQRVDLLDEPLFFAS